ncbi:hypothetical protein JHL22_09790 [Advenella sp. WQ 585]|uniref:BMP family ABC transporter substrate-binding protein n=1 Tax=Advenella mandrilli TaxID=2800330 RepID=A0ABS1EFR5_9BURK|nr:hypothetical protein [Advenella mandrilli]MBK1781511.1 hypothetical protein [Advenella mandrilli]
MKRTLLLSCCLLGLLAGCTAGSENASLSGSKVEMYGIMDIGVGYTNQKTTFSK